MSSVTIKGIDATEKSILKLMNKARHEAFLQKIADLGYKVANSGFINPTYDGVNDVEVSIEWVSDNEIQIVASGQAVCFIEFGSGVKYQEDYPDRPSELAPIGTYGQGNGSKNWWLFKDRGGTGTKFEGKEGLIITHGNPPAKAMYNARVEMENNISKIAREVLFS